MSLKCFSNHCLALLLWVFLNTDLFVSQGSSKVHSSLEKKILGKYMNMWKKKEPFVNQTIKKVNVSLCQHLIVILET